MLRNIQNAKVLFCFGALQSRAADDANIKVADTTKKFDIVINPTVVNPIVPTEPNKTKTSLSSSIAKSVHNLTDNVTGWFLGSDKQDKRGKDDKEEL